MSFSASSYDLSTPAPLPREAATRLLAQKAMIAEQLRVHLRRLLRLRSEAMITAPDVARVRHFASFCDGSAWWFAGGSKADPQGRSVLLGCAPSLIYVAIDRSLGGPGSAVVPAKPPTSIEFTLGTKFLRDVFGGLASSLGLAPLHLEVAPHEPLSEPLLTYIPDLEEPFARLALKVKVMNHEHELLLCISRKLLEAAETKAEEVQATAHDLTAPVASTPIELLVELGRCRLTVDEAARLQAGDVVMFDQPPGEPIEVKVQGKTRMRARFGTHLERYAVEVIEVVDAAAKQASAAAAASAGPASGGPSAAPSRPRST